MIKINALTGEERKQALPVLAELRILVFKEWPYLYDGSLEYEAEYLRKFSEARDSLMVVATDGGKVVGASTASPLVGHADAFAAPFKARGYDPSRVFYFGESVLMNEYRGQGIGNAFFDFREQHARELGCYDLMTFCAVVRDSKDLRRPASYRPLDRFWQKRGFDLMEGLTTHFDWKEPGSVGEVHHLMQFWGKTVKS